MQLETFAKTLARIALLGGLAFAAPAFGQVLEDLEVRAQDGNAVITVRFGVRVQFLRTAMSPKKDLMQVYFQITGGEENTGRTIEEFRRSPPTDLVPAFTVTYPLQPQTAVRRMDVKFSRPVEASLRPGADNRSMQILVPLPRQAKAPPGKAKPPVAALPLPAQSAAAASDLDKQGNEMLAKARAAIEAGNNEQAVAELNQLLNLPPNAASQEAQETIGVARERMGETAKARAEYELFLKLYPDSAGAARVRERLAALSAAPAAGAAKPAAKPTLLMAWGSLSQYYYGGNSQSQTQIITVTPATNATTIDTASLSSKDQSALVTNIDANARYRSDTVDARLVFRDTQTTSFLKSQENENRLTALFGEVKGTVTPALARVGRQSATSGGVLGRFDGALVNYGFAPQFRLNVVGGRPVETLPGLKPVFYGAFVEADNLGERWSGNVFAIKQTLQGATDRFALGGEARYNDAGSTVYALLDYDTRAKALNIGMFQATLQTDGGTNVNLLADYRRTPPLQVSNAILSSASTMSFRELLDAQGESGVLAMADLLTPISKVFLASVTHQFTRQWQLGGDVRVSSLTAIPAFGALAAVPATGNIYTYSAQAIGTGLVDMNDVTVFSASYLTGTLNKAWSAFANSRLQVAERWLVEPSFKWYRQRDNADVQLVRITGGLKLSYRVLEKVMLESEFTLENSHTTGALIDDDTTRRFYYVGYRWDF
jgi:tetratricopeptide (TPR) repeat protein